MATLFCAWPVTVEGANTTATEEMGVTVNGVDVGVGAGTGWSYATNVLTLSGAGPFVLSSVGASTNVRVVVRSNLTCAVTMSDLRLSNSVCSPFLLETNANVSLTLVGQFNELIAHNDPYAGLQVPAGTTLSITNAEGNPGAYLLAMGGTSPAPASPVGLISLRNGMKRNKAMSPTRSI